MAVPLSSSASGSTVLAGEVVCLTASVIWAFSIHLFRPPILAFGPRAVNLVKCVLGTALFGVTAVALGQVGALASAPAYYLWILIISGWIGLSAGDTLLFVSVREIGVHRTQLLQTLAPLFATLLAVIWRGESFGLAKACGTALILGGVALVVAPGRAVASQVTETFDVALVGGASRHGVTLFGVAIGVLSALCQGVNFVIAKVGMERVPIMGASFLRMAAGAGGLLVISLFNGGLRRAGRAARSPMAVRYMVPAALLGTYLGIGCMMAGLAWAPASTATVLLATTPVFTMIVEAVTGHEPFTWRSGTGTILTVAGVAVLTVW